ncbi:RNA polymerase sigma factor [Labilithrix luteola]|uniref:RNA polymerase sigma factor n=1 Tax=Labilithrix luteola TaxID=1391654 RepID=UPI001F0A6081|nr:RNA polymerase sigma factor [Labilithrix luteola]
MSPPVRVNPRIEAASRGDRAALTALAEELIPRVRNLVRYLTKSGDIDDITQEALVTVLRSVPNYRPIGSFTAWVDRIVVRVTYGELRKRRRDATHEAIDIEAVPAPVDPASVYATRTHIAAVLDGLPADQRFAVVLHHALGMSAAEIAEEMSAPLETIRSRLRVGMQHLRRSMNVSNEGDSR